MKKISIAVALLAALSGPTWAVNKCTGSDGKISFQETACAGKGGEITVRPASGDTGGATDRDWKSESAKTDKRLSIFSAIERREAVIGMTPDQLQQAMGLPSRINTGEYKSGSTQQRIYERDGMTWYVYTDGSLVTAVQTSASSSAGRSSRASCPSAHDIRSAETSASSITLSDSERVERQKQIRDMRNCQR